MVVIRSFPFGCTTDHVDAVISTSSYREAGQCGVVWRRADSFGPQDGVGARSDIQDILDGAVAILEKVLSGPSNWSPIMVRLDAMWSRLRGNARFQKLVGQS